MHILQHAGLHFFCGNKNNENSVTTQKLTVLRCSGLDNPENLLMSIHISPK